MSDSENENENLLVLPSITTSNPKKWLFKNESFLKLHQKISWSEQNQT